MKNKDYPAEVLDLTIDHINEKGQGVAYYRHAPDRGSMGKLLVVFMPNVVPGDEVRVTVPNAKGRKRAYLQFDKILKPSPDRNLDNPIKPTIAGGTPLQYMHYDAQLVYKENLVKTYLEKGDFDTSLVRPIIGLENPNHYRNKMEFTFGPNGEIGMHEQGNYMNIVDLEDSLLAPLVMMDIKQTISKWQKEHDLKGYSKVTHDGLLRQLTIRKSSATNEIMLVIYSTKAPDTLQEAVDDLLAKLTEQFNDIVSILWITSTSTADNIVPESIQLLHGRDYINEELNGFHYKLYYDTFFQANSDQAEKMVSIALEMTEMDEDMTVLDLFCGIGTFSLPFAKAAKELVGIELVEQSILSAQENAEKAGLTNTRFFASDARKGLEELKETWPTPDLLLVNPPRGGAGGKMMRSIGRYGSKNIIYVSCNPKTLADDLQWLGEFGYEFIEAQPIDQFPHTVHVETVLLLSKKDSD